MGKNGWLTWNGTNTGRHGRGRANERTGTCECDGGERMDANATGAYATARKTACKAADVAAHTKTFKEKTWSPIVYENGQKAHTLTQERFEVIQDLDGFAKEEVRTERKKNRGRKRKTTMRSNVTVHGNEGSQGKTRTLTKPRDETLNVVKTTTIRPMHASGGRATAPGPPQARGTVLATR